MITKGTAAACYLCTLCCRFTLASLPLGCYGCYNIAAKGQKGPAGFSLPFALFIIAIFLKGFLVKKNGQWLLA
jgi:hypothetical protein